MIVHHGLLTCSTCMYHIISVLTCVLVKTVQHCAVFSQGTGIIAILQKTCISSATSPSFSTWGIKSHGHKSWGLPWLQRRPVGLGIPSRAPHLFQQKTNIRVAYSLFAIAPDAQCWGFYDFKARELWDLYQAERKLKQGILKPGWHSEFSSLPQTHSNKNNSPLLTTVSVSSSHP